MCHADITRHVCERFRVVVEVAMDDVGPGQECLEGRPGDTAWAPATLALEVVVTVDRELAVLETDDSREEPFEVGRLVVVELARELLAGLLDQAEGRRRATVGTLLVPFQLRLAHGFVTTAAPHFHPDKKKVRWPRLGSGILTRRILWVWLPLSVRPCVGVQGS